jgi:tellurite resistance protein
MSAIDNELRTRFSAFRYLEKLKHNKKLAREVMKTHVVVWNPVGDGYFEVAPKAGKAKGPETPSR